MTSHGNLIRATGAALVRLGVALGKAASVQWLPPAAPSKRGDTTERSAGIISNPTLDTATDERRLKVRAAVIEAESFLEDTASRADSVAEKLTDAFHGWAGERA